MPFALDQESPATSELSASSGSVVAHCFAIPGGRAFPADFTSATAAALPFALDQEGPVSPEDTAISDSVVAPCFLMPGGRASPAMLTPALASSPGRADLASPEDTASADAVVNSFCN